MTYPKEAIKKTSMTSILSANNSIGDHESWLDNYWELCTIILKLVLTVGEAFKSPPSNEVLI